MSARDLSKELAELRDLVIRRSRLLEISVTLNSTLDRHRLLQFIIDSAADLVESEAASILLVDEKTQDLYFAAATGSSPSDLRAIPVPMDGSIAGTIVREGTPLIINEVASDPRHFRQVDETTHQDTRSLIGVPMRIKDRITGVLEAVNKREGAFDESDLRTLEIIASQAAVAIYNADLLDALQRAYNELDKVEKLKSDFISVASHELRTPLGVILGYAALLKEDAGPGTSEHADAVLNSALRMRTLIEDMTNMNLMQIGSSEVVLQEHALGPIAQEAADEIQEMIQAKGQTLRLEVPQEPLVAQVDSGKLTLALINLLSNAMRFTESGRMIRLGVSRRGSEAWIAITDQGIGLADDQLERIFDRFYQVEDHMTRRHGGMGLGLAIVKAIVEAHQGRVWAESEGQNKGATFTVALPAAK
jgi:signal transduction histidine kinase